MTATAQATTTTQPPPHSDIGAAFDPVTNREQLPELLRRARAEEPVFYAPKFDAYVVTRYKDVKFVLNHAKDFSSVGTLEAAAKICPEADAILNRDTVQWPMPRVLANSDAPEHPRIRGATNRELSPRRFQEMEPLLHDIANASIDRWINKGRTEFVKDFAYDFPLTVILGVLGLPLSDLDRIKKWGASWVQLLFHTEAGKDEQIAWAKSIAEYQQYIRAYIDEVRANPRGDFMSGLVASVFDTGKMTLGELVTLIGLNIIPGAHETTAAFMTACLYNFLHDRKNWEAICADPSLIPNAAEEVLRFDGPGVGFYRRVTQGVTVGDVYLPPNSRAFYCHFSGNRDESVFENPEVFDIHRANASSNIAFGQGNHFCLGAPLARREGRIALEILTKRLPSLRLVPGQKEEFYASFVLRGHSRLEVEWDERR